MTSQLVVVRHVETAWTAQGRLTGTTDVPLTPRGEQQARAHCDRLSHLSSGSGVE